mgnify:CR=1 FL=1
MEGFRGTTVKADDPTEADWNDAAADERKRVGVGCRVLTCTFECRTVLLSFVSHESHGKATSTLVSKLDYRASVPMLERRLFLCRFTLFHLRFSYLLPVFQNNEARGRYSEERE